MGGRKNSLREPKPTNRQITAHPLGFWRLVRTASSPTPIWDRKKKKVIVRLVGNVGAGHTRDNALNRVMLDKFVGCLLDSVIEVIFNADYKIYAVDSAIY
jgi:hypothetical protein